MSIEHKVSTSEESRQLSGGSEQQQQKQQQQVVSTEFQSAGLNQTHSKSNVAHQNTSSSGSKPLERITSNNSIASIASFGLQSDCEGGAEDDSSSNSLSCQRRFNVYLGGSFGDSTWRKELAIPALTNANLSFFDPSKDEWSADNLMEEAAAKEAADIHLYVIGPQTRAISSMLQAVESIMTGRTVVLVVHEIKNGLIIHKQTLSARQIRDLNRARMFLLDLVDRNQDNSVIFCTVQEALNYITGYYSGDRAYSSSKQSNSVSASPSVSFSRDRFMQEDVDESHFSFISTHSYTGESSDENSSSGSAKPSPAKVLLQPATTKPVKLQSAKPKLSLML
mmetsp:Transcript_44264/g.86607  ORF Transcript_44264/g.86607 Transcript_44264/m.86607 type:complete len:337 (+) Transcript_44264:106-1116(+)|eukprot:CAMPEP_0175090858 /NCGR_PEP_ID=MMETSP0086_2-20121207/1585_1 /TAXON_ID=136419 /ORGANISM="Unknown Unknown, Strain D1" /LENGTH=336 /DNA_ID=CAMNT_0016363545 /DNA_START=105 /DNA_END=1115 /DNA_ORIENTATION=-